MYNTSTSIPIVDTDIWVFLIQSGFEKRVIKRYGHILISDVVEREILKWDRNQGDSKSIAEKFKFYKQNQQIKVITFDSFSDEDQSLINHQLTDYGLKHVGVIEKNKGEFVSMLYALYSALKIFKTNDRNFVKEIDDSIHEKIKITNWDELLDKYSISIKEKAEARRVTEIKQTKMQKERPSSITTDPRLEVLRSLVG